MRRWRYLEPSLVSRVSLHPCSVRGQGCCSAPQCTGAPRGGTGPRRSAARGGDAPREPGRRARAQRGAGAGARPRSTGTGPQGVVSHPRLGLLLRQLPQISELLGNAPFQQLSVPFSMDKILGGRTGCGMCGPSFFGVLLPGLLAFSRRPAENKLLVARELGAGGPCPCASVCIAWASA